MIIRDNNNNFIKSDLLEIMDLPGQIILNRAVNRWQQEWEIIYSAEKVKFEKKDCDDVSIIVIDIFMENL